MANISDIKNTDWIGFVYGKQKSKWIIAHCKTGTFTDRCNREEYEIAIEHDNTNFTSQISLLEYILSGLVHVYRFPDEETMLEWLLLKEE